MVTWRPVPLTRYTDTTDPFRRFSYFRETWPSQFERANCFSSTSSSVPSQSPIVLGTSDSRLVNWFSCSVRTLPQRSLHFPWT